MSLIAAILVFSLIIIFHEFGHFLFAKLGGICVVEFSLGMGPRLFSFSKGGTRYSLKLLPFGGSCAMLGEDEEPETEEEKAAEEGGEPEEEENEVHEGLSFNETSVWTRFLVIAGGPLFNFVLALLCSFFIIGYIGYDAPVVQEVMDGFPAQEAGLEPGDEITGLNGRNIRIYRDITMYTGFHRGETLEVEYRRDGENFRTVLEPAYSEEHGTYLMGITGGGYEKTGNPFKILKYSVYEMRYWISLTFKSLGMLLHRQVSTDDIAGPVRIVSMIDTTVKETAQFGIMMVLINLANLCVLLSVNLGIMNLLPIPALDGGRLVFIILEAIRGKAIDREKEGMIHMAGMAALLALMVFVLFNDIRHLI